MGTQDSVRAVFYSALHVDRSFLLCRAISLSDRSRIVRLGKKNHGSDYYRWNLFPAVSIAIRVSATAHRWLARCALRLVSWNGCAAQSAPITSRSVHANSARYLFSSYARFRSCCDDGLVRSNRVVAGSNVSTSLDRYRWRFCPGRILLLSLSRACIGAASGCESPCRFVLHNRRGGYLDSGRGTLAMGSPAYLASHRSRHRGDRVFQSGPHGFSQD